MWPWSDVMPQGCPRLLRLASLASLSIWSQFHAPPTHYEHTSYRLSSEFLDTYFLFYYFFFTELFINVFEQPISIHFLFWSLKATFGWPISLFLFIFLFLFLFFCCFLFCFAFPANICKTPQDISVITSFQASHRVGSCCCPNMRWWVVSWEWQPHFITFLKTRDMLIAYSS